MSTKKETTRRRLLEAAEALLLERGFYRVSLEDIAEAAGVSRQAVYKSHFASKADLLLALVRHVHESKKLDELIAPVLAAQAPVDRLEKTIFAIVDIQTRLHDFSLLLSAAATSDADARGAWRDRVEVKRSAIHLAVSLVDAQGQLRPEWSVEQAVDLLLTLLSAESYQELVVQRGWRPQELKARVVEICAANLLIAGALDGRKSGPPSAEGCID